MKAIIMPYMVNRYHKGEVEETFYFHSREEARTFIKEHPLEGDWSYTKTAKEAAK
jgi:hypothetical protein